MSPPTHDHVLASVAGLRVLAFADWYSPAASGGAERAAWEVYRRLGAAGARVHVVSAAHGPAHEDPGVEVDVIRALDLSRLAGGYLAPAPGAFAAARRAAARFGPDVVHVNTIHYTASIAGAWLARRRRLPLVVTVQLGSLEHLPGRSKAVAAAYKRLVGGYILRRADRVLAVSAPARDHAVSLGARAEAVSPAPNGVDLDRFAVTPLRPSPEPLVIAVGRLTANKGPDVLVEAAAILARDGLPFRLAFVGDGPERPALEARVAAAGLSSRTEFTGHVPDVERWMEKADIVVRPSYTEGLALAVLEGMASGRCNVVSDIPPNLELVRDRDNGLTFRSGDPADLARALRVALLDPGLRAALGRRARADATPYTWDEMARRHAAALLDASGRS
jgi:glycosyltransferase involved in cell wall biosynthesis